MSTFEASNNNYDVSCLLFYKLGIYATYITKRVACPVNILQGLSQPSAGYLAGVLITKAPVYPPLAVHVMNPDDAEAVILWVVY